MQFERGLDPKESIGVGLKANAPLIGVLYRAKIELEYGWDRQYVSQKRTLNVVDASEVVHILEGLSKGEIPLDAFVFEQNKTILTDEQKLEQFTDYRGKYLKYVNRILSHRAVDQYDHYNQEYIFLIP